MRAAAVLGGSDRRAPVPSTQNRRGGRPQRERITPTARGEPPSPCWPSYCDGACGCRTIISGSSQGSSTRAGRCRRVSLGHVLAVPLLALSAYVTLANIVCVTL